MKNLKFLLGVLAIVFTVASAFTVNKVSAAKATTTDHFFRYDGADNSNGEIQSAGNWVYLGETEPTLGCDELSGVICYIRTTMDETTFFANLSSQTETSLAPYVEARKE